MARLSQTARADIDRLLGHYIRLESDEAIRNLRLAVGQAVVAISASPEAGRPFPPPYSRLTRWGYRWVKIHRYWFAYVARGGEAVVMNVLYETSNIPRRVAAGRRG